MLTIGAFVLLLACVFGSYTVSGGSLDVLAEALPFELWTIGGAAVASFMMANSMHDPEALTRRLQEDLLRFIFQEERLR
jgi:chemotaxis protein MotA